MASTEPTPDEVSQVIDFAGLDPVEDRTMIIQALKVCLRRGELKFFLRFLCLGRVTDELQNNSRNVETVVMSYFDNPASVSISSLTPFWLVLSLR